MIRWIKVTLGYQKCLAQNQLLYLRVVVVHYVVVDVPLLLVDLQEVGHLLRRQFLPLVAGRLVVHHLVQLRQRLRVVLV
mgnify:CR=1 FL=1